MENLLKTATLDEEFMTVEVELKSAAVDEELKCAAMEVELKSTAMEEELKGTAVAGQFKLICQICDKAFSHPSNRNHHMRQVHQVEPIGVKKNSVRNICPISDCREKFFRIDTLRDHIIQIHKIELEVQEKIFRSYEDFWQWKENMERETKSHYVTRQSARTASRIRKKFLKEFFACDRSGCYTPRGAGNKRRRIGSKRIGAFCPASLAVLRSTVNSYVKVVHWRTHLGHKCDMNHLPLTKSEKMEIADKIKKGMSFSEIIKSYKDAVRGPELHRINFLSRRDLSNIVEKFRIKRKKVSESDDDLVNLWVRNMRQEFVNDSPVAFFKKQGIENNRLNSEDFMIVIMTKYQKELFNKYEGMNICVDSIHGMRLQSFSLTALLMIDEQSAVFPVAFCISSKTDEVSMMVFFESVKRLVGTIETPVFMSNDDPVFYDAWEKVMAPTSFQLLCNWHVDSCWRRDLNKIGDKDKQASVYKTLRMLVEERDVSEFKSSIDTFVAEMEEDASTKKFAECFSENYLPRMKMWAFCYMRHLGFSTVEHLEALHTALKNLFLEGGEDNVYNSQVNIAIPALLKLSRDELLSRLEVLLDGQCNPDGWIGKIHKGHKQGLKAHNITALNNNSWSVKLFKRGDGHVVTENEICSLEVCYLRCTKCNICIHSFFCTCVDNLINLNICGHMHACAKFSKHSKSQVNVVGRNKVNGVVSEGKVNIAGRNGNINGVISVGKVNVNVAVGNQIMSGVTSDGKVNVNVAAGNQIMSGVTSDGKVNVAGRNENMNEVISDENEMVDTVVGNEEVTETSLTDVSVISSLPTAVNGISTSSKTLLTKQLNTIKTMMEYSDYTEEHASQLKNSFDAIISFMIMHGKSRKPLIQVPYKPTKTYLSTVNQKPDIQYNLSQNNQNHGFTTGSGLSVCIHRLSSNKLELSS